MTGVEKLDKFGIIEPLGLGKWNNEGDRLIKFYKQNSLFLFITCFKQYTLPRNIKRWLIGNGNWRNTNHSASSFSGESCWADYALLITNTWVKHRPLKKIGVSTRIDSDDI